MNRTLRAFALACAVSICLADIAPPPPRGKPATLIVHSEEASAFSLLIPADLLQSARAPESSSDGRMRGVIASVLLSLSVMVAGILFVKWRQIRPARMGLFAAALAIAGAGLTLADMPGNRHPVRPPIPLPIQAYAPGTLTRLREVLDTAKSLEGNVSVEIGPAGSPILLIVPGPRQPRFRPPVQ